MSETIVTAVQAAEYRGFFTTFNNSFLDANERRQRAISLHRGVLSGNFGSANVPSRSVLCSQWGDDQDQLRETAYFLYGLGTAIEEERAFGQMVLAFGAGTAEQLKVDNRRDLPEVIRLAMGTVDASELAYGFNRSKPPRVKPDSTQRGLGFQVSVPVTNYQSLEVRRSGAIELKRPANKPELVVYSGKVLLDASPAVYLATRSITRPEVLFGDRQAHDVIRDIVRLVGGVPQENFLTLKEAGIIHPHRPLPDLSTVFSPERIPDLPNPADRPITTKVRAPRAQNWMETIVAIDDLL